MENADKIIDIFGELTTNYKHLMNKLEDKKIQDLKNKCNSDFKDMKNDMGKLILSENPEKDIEQIEEKHRKVYYENHFAVEKIFDKSVKSEEIEEKDPTKLMKIVRLLTEKLEELTVDHENLLKDVEENNKKTVKVPYNERKFMEETSGDIFSLKISCNNREGTKYIWVRDNITELCKKYEVNNLYAVYVSKDDHGWGLSAKFKLYTKYTLIEKYHFLEKNFDKIFYMYLKGDVGIYFYDKAIENKQIEISIDADFMKRFFRKDIGNLEITSLYLYEN